jgi:hypothetical protein
MIEHGARSTLRSQACRERVAGVIIVLIWVTVLSTRA